MEASLITLPLSHAVASRNPLSSLQPRLVSLTYSFHSNAVFHLPWCKRRILGDSLRCFVGRLGRLQLGMRTVIDMIRNQEQEVKHLVERVHQLQSVIVLVDK